MDPRRSGWLRTGQYEDLPTDAPPDEDKKGDEPEGSEDDSSAAWERETRQVKRKLEMQTSSSSSFARPGGEAVLSLTVENTPMQAEQPTCAKSVQEPKEVSKHKNHVQFS